MDPSPELPGDLLRQNLRGDSLERERAVVRLMVIGVPLVTPLVFLMGGAEDRPVALRVVAVLSVLWGVYFSEWWLLRQGRYSSAMSALNVLLEVSVPAPIIALAAIHRGPADVFSLPSDVIWGTFVVMSAMRLVPRLPLLAGALTAAEWLVEYFLLVRPQLSIDSPRLWLVPAAITRALLLFASGVLGELLVRTFTRRAQEALRSVREQDLMSKYVLHGRIGAGGMAEVFRATYCPEGGFQKTVAVKRVRSDETLGDAETFTRMLVEEARLGAALAHPNIVQVLDCGRFRGTFVLAMEFVDGISIDRLLQRLRAPLPLAAATFVAAEVASALAYLHDKRDAEGAPLQLIHGDVNPPNVLVSRIGEVKLGDFGVSNAVTRARRETGAAFFGKEHYAAPEQLYVNGTWDHRADLFALGLTLFEMLTGRRAYDGDEGRSVKHGIFIPPPNLAEHRSDAPRALVEVYERLTRRAPEERPQSAAAVRSMLLALPPEAAPSPSGVERLAELMRGSIKRADEVADSEWASTVRGIDRSSESTRELDGRPKRKTRRLES